ncbi:MAG: DUF4231 domain-containing protein [Chitinophagaceae bacterium]|nr:MAG: DUF4231 domain-containing protein [Chitinophagaceae bacterium]
MPEINKQVISFSNNRSALAAISTATSTAEEIRQALNVPAPQAVILSIGGADKLDDSLMPRLTQLYGRGIARAAAGAKALIIDGGTAAGVMALMGEGVAAQGYRSTLIGVAPINKVSFEGGDNTAGTQLEPNHTHFVLTEGKDWGSETSTMFSLLSVFTNQTNEATNQSFIGADTKAITKVPAVVILAGGGTIAKTEVIRSVRQNLPLIVVKGSGGLADEIAAVSALQANEIDDPVMAEIIADGNIYFHALTSSVKALERLIIRQLGSDKVLLQAWETFAIYDLNANRQQKRFDKLQQGLILLGVLSVALVVVQQVWAPRNTEGELVPTTLKDVGFWWWALYHFLIIIPIVITVLVTAANRFKQGNKWLLLRAGAEAIKREIFRYRTRASRYSDNAEQLLSKAVEEITRRTMRTEVNMSALVPYDKDKGFPPNMYAAQGGDDGFSFLSADRYVEVRLGDQLNYFRKKTVRLEKQLRRLYWGTFIVGGIGTYMAAIGMQVWVALTTSVVVALGTYLGYRQTESTLMKYNQAATDLSNVKAWWEALSSEEQAQQVNIDSLVEHTEQVLQTEMDGWIQQMQNALADLRKGQEPPTTEKSKSIVTSVSDITIKTETVEEQQIHEEIVDEKEPAIAEDENHNTKTTNASEVMKPVGQFE